MPKISAIIITFNRADFLKKAIESVLNQTNPNFELLILDNSSTDNTEEIVKSFRDKRVRYIKHQPLNISQARNLGLKESKGDYIAFLDDDDEWLPEKLEKELEIFNQGNGKLGLAYGGFIRIDENGKEFEWHIPTLKGNIFEPYLCRQDPLTGSASNPLIKKSVFKIVGEFDENLSSSEDWEFYIRLFEKFEADFTSEPVVKIRSHSKYRLGGRTKDELEAELLVYNRYKDVLEKCLKVKSFYLQAIGGKFCRIGNPIQGRRYIKDAIIVFPLNFPAYFQYIFSFFNQSFYQKMHKLYKNVVKTN
jgi:glycosyltransferase involved in cell wall biosynthesis